MACGSVSLKNILLDSFFFDETIFPLLWCMKSFFISSIISAVISSINRGGGKDRSRDALVSIIIAIFFCIMSGNIWIAIGLLGGVVFYTEPIIEKNRRLRVVGLIVTILLIVIYKIIMWNYNENEFIYVFQGILCSFLFLMIKSSRYKWGLNNAFLAWGGKISFYIYLSHVPINYIWGYYIMNFLLDYMQLRYAFIIVFISTSLIVLLVSYILYNLIEKRIVEKILKNIRLKKEYNHG